MRLLGGSWAVLALTIWSAACGGEKTGKSSGVGGAGGGAAGKVGGANAGRTQAGTGGLSGSSSGHGGQAGEGGSGALGTAGDGSGGAGPLGGAGGEPNVGEGGEGGTTSDDELSHVFNLVDPDAAAELEAYLVAGESGPIPLSDPGGLVLGVNGFLERYEEDYDFLFLTTDHAVDSNTYGKFESVNYEISRGTGNDFAFRKPGYETNGRLKGVAGLQFVHQGFGPFGHELFHYWANHLDRSLGFGVGLDFNSTGHWGYADIHGQLGGYDGAAIECATPAGATPPACDAETNGRYRYVTPFFAPNANGVSIPYAPFELYLMGLLPKGDVPAIHLLENAEQVAQNPTTRTTTLEADGIKTVKLDDIIALHGEVTPLPPERRGLKLAFVVVSATPAPPEVLAEVAHNSAIFGNRAADPDLPSFESLTGGRATMDTRLGARRKPSDPAPEYVPFSCDPVAQDCEAPGAACNLNGQERLCVLTKGVAQGDPCDANTFECAPGLECIYDLAGTSTYCSPFCDPSDSSSPLYCPSICSNFIVLGTLEGEVIAGRCRLK